jgi:hypothetical protein
MVFQQILSITVRFIQKDSEEKKNSFNARPYFRLFISWLQDLLSPEPVVDGVNFQVLLIWTPSIIVPIQRSICSLMLIAHATDLDSLCWCIPQSAAP